jgi:hypothetical protein
MIGTVVGNTSTDSYRFILRSFRAKVGDIVATLSAIPDDNKSHGNAIIWGRIVSIDRHNPFFPAEAAQELAEQNLRLIDTVLSTSRDYLNAEVLILGSSNEDSSSQMDLSPLTYRSSLQRVSSIRPQRRYGDCSERPRTIFRSFTSERCWADRTSMSHWPPIRSFRAIWRSWP